MEKNALVILNPSAGKEKAEGFADEILELLKTRFETVEVRKTEKAGDAKRFASDAARDGYDLVVAMGGDGTVNEAVNGLSVHEKRPRFGIIPMGTVNDLARALGIPVDPEEAISVLEGKHRVFIDIGKANERYFSNAFAVGRIPESVHEVTAEEKSRLGPLAYVLAVAKKLMEKEKIHVKVSFDEDSWEGELAAILIGLTGSFGGIQDVLPEAGLGDGRLHVILVRDLTVMETLKLVPGIFTGKLTESENIAYLVTDRIHIEAQGCEEYVSDVDGEKGPKLPITVELLKRHIEVLVPEKK